MDLHESAVTDTGSDTGKDDNAVDQSVSCADGEAADDFEESEVEHAPTLTAPAMAEVQSEPEALGTPLSPLLIAQLPSLRGELKAVGKVVSCRGVWAANDSLHGVAGQTSDFEIKLVKPASAEAAASFPTSGKYSGWFHLKNANSGKPLKIDERDINITFAKTEDGNFTVEGSGSNRIGKFQLHGTLSANNALHLHKSYIAAPPPPEGSAPTGTAGAKRKSAGGSESAKKKVASAPADASTPRESPRPRKPTPVEQPKKASVSFKDADKNDDEYVDDSKVSAVTAPPTGRSQRLSSNLVKCSDLLKEFQKMPQSVWFLEPVDYVKLDLPDYPTIVSKPMDFRTIRNNLESRVYATPEQFGEDVRLVFRNAMTYNHLRDHPVHIAARELSYKFEEKFRQLMVLFNAPQPLAALMNPLDTDLAGPRGVSPRASIGSINGSKKGSKPRPGTPGAVKGRQPMFSGGPRPLDYLAPPSVDAGTAQFLEMQRKMQAMESELTNLKTVMRQKEIKNTLEEKRDAAKTPLTFDEKKDLIAQIHKLPADNMQVVIEIIQAAMPQTDGEEIEVPLDDLDTQTLRKLQNFVDQCNLERKKKLRQTQRDKDSKKQRVGAAAPNRGKVGPGAVSVFNPSSTSNLSATGDDQQDAAAVLGDDMLFNPDALDEIDEIEMSNAPEEQVTN